jgi:hypothetical protein
MAMPCHQGEATPLSFFYPLEEAMLRAAQL